MRKDLNVSRVAKSFGGAPAVDGVSFHVPDGSFFSILGPSGCGKTTLMRMIAGFVGQSARWQGLVERREGGQVLLRTDEGLPLVADWDGEEAAAQLFVRPEAIQLARAEAELGQLENRFEGRLDKLLFDGAASSVLIAESSTGSLVRVFWTVLVPFLKPALIGAFLMSFENFNTTLMLVGSDRPLPIYMYGQMREAATPAINAISLILVLATGLLAGGVAILSNRRR